ncbi:hypothetical protein DM01DRAFT_1340548 [Hesseltinella vesiculosa]|uniref:Uncharacterized protein n=1 Tax=Hesseltinella vesiculosa TaxID=101127 RepID=A0A1X2G4R6_9FUNG|nr:hypothetical protein DM01DRAFT_1340548 [Hesseltinella vesiculosa]
MNNATRQNPRQCSGCRFRCQHVLVHGPATARPFMTDDEWFDYFMTVEPPISDLLHVCNRGQSLALYFATLQSAYYVLTHRSGWAGLWSTEDVRGLIFTPARIYGHFVKYHRVPHPYRLCHLA